MPKHTPAERRKTKKERIQKGVKAARKRSTDAPGNPDDPFVGTRSEKIADKKTQTDAKKKRDADKFGFIESKTKGERPKHTPTAKEKADLKKRPKTAAAASANQLRDKIDQEKKTGAIRRRRRGQR